MASTAMPQITHTSTRPFPSEKPYFGGALGNRGAPLSGGHGSAHFYTVCNSISVRPPGDLPAASECGRQVRTVPVRPRAAALAPQSGYPGVRRGPDVSQIWETSERRRCNGFAPRQARKTRTAAQHSDNENIHGGNKPRHLERRTPPYPRKPQNKLRPSRSSWPRSGTGCSG